MCPWNQRFAEEAAERDYAAREEWEAEWPVEDVSAETSGDSAPSEDDDGPRPDSVIPSTDGPALIALMRMSEDEWDAFTRGSAIRRAGYAWLRRNVAIAIGNWLAASDTPDPDAVGALVAALSDEDPVVAEAAAWGLRRNRGRLG